MVSVKPFTTKQKNMMEIINEIGVVISLYALVPLSDLVDSGKIKSDCGYAVLGIVSFMVIINLMVVVKDTVGTFNKWRLNRKLKRMLELERNS